MKRGIFRGKYKAITFSFDDGNVDDIRLIGILNKYKLKATFNLNSGSLSNNNCWRFGGIKDVKHINYFDHPDLYLGHEIAGHSYTHAELTKLDEFTLLNEIKTDKYLLELLYKTEIKGFVYPYGKYNNSITEAVKVSGFTYARTTRNTYTFELPQDRFRWHPTCKFTYGDIEEIARQFFETEEKNIVFYIWGHSYELITESDWQKFESLCKLLSGHKDIYYCTNTDVINCLK